MRWRRPIPLPWWLRRAIGLAGVSTIGLWFIPEQSYEAVDWRDETTEQREYTYFSLGWPEKWLVSKVTLKSWLIEKFDGGSRYTKFQKVGPKRYWELDNLPKNTSENRYKVKVDRFNNVVEGPVIETIMGLAIATFAMCVSSGENRQAKLNDTSNESLPS